MLETETNIILSAHTLFKKIGTVIVCFSTGKNGLEYMEPLLREPSPPTGWELNADFEFKFNKALELNPSIHDGAIAFNRGDETKPYVLQAWSCRLLPSISDGKKTPNKGVAWNSCLSISRVDALDKVILFSAGKFIEFIEGENYLLHQGREGP